jgi:hypothetical protein
MKGNPNIITLKIKLRKLDESPRLELIFQNHNL